MKNKLKPWWQIINFYKLIGLVLIWISAWLFMVPLKVDITAPYFNNIWGEMFAALGLYRQETVTAQQRPDLMSALIALVLMIILQVRGIFKFTVENEKEALDQHRPLTVCLNLLCVLVHTVFFTMLIKIFLFPNMGPSASLVEKMKADIWMTVFAAVSVTGMILGAQSLARILLLVFTSVCIFKNITFINQALGLWGFAAILFAIAGFYLEFCGGGISRTKLLMDLNFLAGRYDSMELKANEEGAALTDRKTSLFRKKSRLSKIEAEKLPEPAEKTEISESSRTVPEEEKSE